VEQLPLGPAIQQQQQQQQQKDSSENTHAASRTLHCHSSGCHLQEPVEQLTLGHEKQQQQQQLAALLIV
jgi:hypothetical protein